MLTRAAPREDLGIFADLQARRVQFARFIAKPDRVAVKGHRITVDLRTGLKTVEAMDFSATAVAVPRTSTPTLRPASFNPFAPRAIELPITRRQHTPDHSIRLLDLLQAVTETYGVTMRELLKSYGIRRIVHARFAAMMLMRDLRKMSTPQIGFALGGRDHTTIINGLLRAGDLHETDHHWRSLYLAAYGAVQKKRGIAP